MKRSGWLRKKTIGKRTPKASKFPKPKIWSMTRADDEFSLWIRNRDGRCLFPGCTVTDIKKLTCSHYFGRAHKSTRYDPDNNISLCWRHHIGDKLLAFEYQKQTKEKHGYDGQYTLFMAKWLGPKRWKALQERGRSTKKLYDAIVDCMTLLGKTL